MIKWGSKAPFIHPDGFLYGAAALHSSRSLQPAGFYMQHPPSSLTSLLWLRHGHLKARRTPRRRQPSKTVSSTNGAYRVSDVGLSNEGTARYQGFVQISVVPLRICVRPRVSHVASNRRSSYDSPHPRDTSDTMGGVGSHRHNVAF